MSNDIMDGLATIRVVFQRVNLEPPTTLLLGSHEEGMRFLSLLRQQDHWVAMVGSASMGEVIEMADGSAWMQIKVMGMNVRWPANRIATPDGSWSFT